MTDFIIWTLVIAVTALKGILFAVLIIAVWSWIKKNDPKAIQDIKSYKNSMKEKVKEYTNDNKERSV